MLSVLLQFIPLALAAIAPTMVILVTVLLATRNGVAKSLAVVAGRFAAHLLIAVLLVFLISQLPERAENGRTEGDIIPVILLITGIVLLLLAAYSLLHETDPDRPPSRVSDLLRSVGPGALFVINFGIVLVSLRLLSLVVAGSAIINKADLNEAETVICTILLAGAMVWPMLVPLGYYAAKGEDRGAALDRMRAWLLAHQSAINVAVLTFFGAILVFQGITDL